MSIRGAPAPPALRWPGHQQLAQARLLAPRAGLEAHAVPPPAVRWPSGAGPASAVLPKPAPGAIPAQSGRAPTVQCLSSDVLARLALGEPNLPNTTAGQRLRAAARRLEDRQKDYDDWDWNTLSSAVYMEPEQQLDLLREASDRLFRLMRETEDLLTDLNDRNRPLGAEYVRLNSAAKRLHDAQVADYREHEQTMTSLLQIGDRDALQNLINGADTAFDHVGVPGHRTKNARTVAETKSRRKDIHSVYESMDQAVDALSDFIAYHWRTIIEALSRGADRTLETTAPTRRLEIEEGSRGRASARWSRRVQVTLTIRRDRTFRIEHFHPLSD